ncbi:MAG: TonB-dependent receptor plug domain-containing protein [Kofleriaceae bacterium]
MSRRTYLIPIATLLWSSPPVLAQPAPADPDAVFDERADKPFDRGTELRLTGAELAARGAVDLASALALLPDVIVRGDGHGGQRVELRGARDGMVSVFVDGVVVLDPYSRTSDISLIPITDIAQIRVATTPQSPIDGLGGAGGVIEVHTRDAIGSQLVIARLTGDSLPSAGASGTARVALANDLALRLSASGVGGAATLAPIAGGTLDEQRRAATGGGRLEYRAGDLRIVLDGALDDRRHVASSNTVAPNAILLLDYETTARFAGRLDERIGALQLQAQVWSQYLSERARFFTDPALTIQPRLDTRKALRSGLLTLATRPFWTDFRWTGSTTLDFTKSVVQYGSQDPGRSQTTILETAAALGYTHGRFRAELALGLVLPFSPGSSPWPEGKAVASYGPRAGLELTGTLAYKGRTPSLAEQFDPVNGNSRLGPERVAHAELRAIEHVGDRLHLELAPFLRRTSDTFRTSSQPLLFGELVNSGRINVWGIDAQARVVPVRGLEAGAGYDYVWPTSDEVADPGLDLIPHHRFDSWIQVRPERRLSALARVTYASRSHDRGAALGSYVLVEASVAARLAPAYLAVLRVDDLLDTRPARFAGDRGPGRELSLVIQGSWE